LRARARVSLLFTWVLFAILLAGCREQSLVYDVAIEPDTISPNADGVSDVARITYHLSRHARVTILLRDEHGALQPFRSDVSRPPGRYEALFSGVIENRLLPDGSYSMLLNAVADDGEESAAERPLIIEGGEADAIEIRNLNIYPATFTPNRDGINDRVTIGYYLTKEAENVQVYLQGGAGDKHPVPEDKIRPFGQPGNHEHDYDAGVDLGASPPEDGTYTVVVEVEDAVGNRDTVTGELTIVDGGVPIAEIVNRAAVWSTSSVPLGGTLSFTCSVRNIGKAAIRTKGPEPGVTYTTSENFNTKEFYEEPGIFRLGLDYEGNSYGRQYPLRWQLGSSQELAMIDGERYLLPGQTVMIVGHLQILDEPPMVAPRYWLGLIHEQVEIVEDHVEPVPVTIGF